MLKKCVSQYFKSTEVDRNTTWLQELPGTYVVNKQRHMSSGKINYNEISKLCKNYLLSHGEIIIWA